MSISLGKGQLAVVLVLLVIACGTALSTLGLTLTAKPQTATMVVTQTATQTLPITSTVVLTLTATQTVPTTTTATTSVTMTQKVTSTRTVTSPTLFSTVTETVTIGENLHCAVGDAHLRESTLTTSVKNDGTFAWRLSDVQINGISLSPIESADIFPGRSADLVIDVPGTITVIAGQPYTVSATCTAVGTYVTTASVFATPG